MLPDHLEGILNYCRMKVPGGGRGGQQQHQVPTPRLQDRRDLLLKAQRMALTKAEFTGLQNAA
jgi:hypothetical protein